MEYKLFINMQIRHIFKCIKFTMLRKYRYYKYYKYNFVNNRYNFNNFHLLYNKYFIYRC